MSIQIMEKSKERRPGFAIEGTMAITMEDITVMDHLVRIDGERVGHLHGYGRNGGGLNSLVCIKAEDHLAMADLSGLEVRVVASLAVAILNLCC
jgi:hypothetical protein